MPGWRCIECGKTYPEGTRFKEELLVSRDNAGRNIGQTVVKKCRTCVEEQQARENPQGIPKDQKRLF